MRTLMDITKLWFPESPMVKENRSHRYALAPSQVAPLDPRRPSSLAEEIQLLRQDLESAFSAHRSFTAEPVLGISRSLDEKINLFMQQAGKPKAGISQVGY